MASVLKQKRVLGVVLFIVLGVSIAAAAAVAGDWGAAVALGAFYVLAALVVWVWSGRSGDVAAVMRRFGLQVALTSDRNFAQYGFRQATA